MKDKLEVGHFIRTIKGIGRIEEITEDRTKIYFNCDTGLTISFIKKDFTQEEMAQYYKHSDNIIDLIEVGDYVNGSKVYYCYCADEDSTGLFIDTEKGRQWLDKPSQVKSIITKEQFESMSYKVSE